MTSRDESSGREGQGADAVPQVRELVRIAASRHVNLGYPAPGGLLDLRTDVRGVRGLRIEVPRGQAVILQSVGIEGIGVEDPTRTVEVRASRWQGGAISFDPVRLFDLDDPDRAVVLTAADGSAWVELRFSGPVELRRIILRNAPDDGAVQARGIKVSARTRWRSRVLHDDAAGRRAWRRQLRAARELASHDPEAMGLLGVLDLTVRGRYRQAHRSLASSAVSDAHRRWFRSLVNEELLPARGLEWTVHGPQRPFRYWTAREQVTYVGECARVVEALRSLTPNACFGFGSVLAIVRDRALIPHDDDLDLIVAFEPAEASTLRDALTLVENHLGGLGFEVSGPFAAHRHVRLGGGRRVDVFVGIFEGEAVSWYPGARRGLTREIVFPPGSGELLGVPCPIPAQPEAYLERLYGEGWRVPDPFFSHRWDLGAYADLAGAPGAEGGADDGDGGNDRPATETGEAPADMPGRRAATG